MQKQIKKNNTECEYEKASCYFNQLCHLMKKLRSETGCPWDREQDYESLKSCLIEETYEIIDAIDNNNLVNLSEELGDTIFVIIFYYQIALERNDFSFSDSLKKIYSKIVSRHPHVFENLELNNSSEVIDNWEKIKKQEKKHRKSILDGIPIQLPPLLKAQKINKKVEKVGFCWDHIKPMFEKLNEEINELKTAIDKNDKKNQKEELGDVLLLLTNIANKLEINSFNALNDSLHKFCNRFRYLEKQITKTKSLSESSIEEMEHFYQEAKKRTKPARA